LQTDLDALGFQIVGYGCTTCIGNSGPLSDAINEAIKSADLNVAAVLSGNRNFEARIHPHVKSNYLASPPLVVAYALAGSMLHDFAKDPLGTDMQGHPVYLKDIWPSNREVQDVLKRSLSPDMFRQRYAKVFEGDAAWQAIETHPSQTFAWDPASTYVKEPPYFENFTGIPQPVTDITSAKVLAVLGDSITTDHISPAGTIAPQSPAGVYLSEHGVSPQDFNSYGARRGNHEVMIRGTFANTRLKNELALGTTGGLTRVAGGGEPVTIFAAAEHYAKAATPLVVVAGKEYGTGSSRDWAAKGTRLLGVRAVIAESFERIHRSNLVGMGVLPLEFTGGMTRADLALTGAETIDIVGLSAQTLQPRMPVTAVVHRPDETTLQIKLVCRIDTADEVAYLQQGGILPYVLQQLAG
jgi:aconitate hydratase